MQYHDRMMKDCDDRVHGTLNIELFINETVKKTDVVNKDHLNRDFLLFSVFESPIQIMKKSRIITFPSTISVQNTDQFHPLTVLKLSLQYPILNRVIICIIKHVFLSLLSQLFSQLSKKLGWCDCLCVSSSHFQTRVTQLLFHVR